MAAAKERATNFKEIVSAAKNDIEKYTGLALQAEEDIVYYENEIYDLNIDMQLEETIWPASMDYVPKKELDINAPPFYPTQNLKAEFPPLAEGTKLKWILNDETYRVAIAKKNGIIEVKCVTDGGGYCHDSTICQCGPCSEIELSRRLGVPMPPWLNGPPLAKTFYTNEAAWRASLPEGGQITVTPKKLSEKALKVLCTKPLVYNTDAGKLEELEKRFPGAKMVLTTDKEQLEVESMNSEDSNMFRIYSPTTDEIRKNFSEFGAPKKPNLMAEWNGHYIGLTHLF